MPPFYEYRQSGCYAWLAFFLSFAGSKAAGQTTLGGFDFAPVIFLIIVKISKVKVKGSKAKATLALEVGLGDGKTADKVISPKNEYELTVVGSGDNAYAVLDFVDGGNFQYKTMLTTYDTDPEEKTKFEKKDPATGDWVEYGYKYYENLAHLGFKWAFRQSPTNKKAFRIGFYKDATNMFVD